MVELSQVTHVAGYLQLSSTCVRWCALMKTKNDALGMKKIRTCNNYTSPPITPHSTAADDLPAADHTPPNWSPLNYRPLR